MVRDCALIFLYRFFTYYAVIVHNVRLCILSLLFPDFSDMKSDVVFLVDGSDDTKNSFEAIRAFVQKIVENLNVEEGGDRVALVQYSRDATANFYLNSYSTKNEVQNSIQSVKHKAGRPLNSGAALQFIKDKIFTPSSGGRHVEGARQILYLFSGGRSNDDIRGASQALKESKIIVFTFGTRNADALELQTMSSTPEYAFSIPDFTFIDSTYQIVASFTDAEGSGKFTTSLGKNPYTCKNNTYSTKILLYAYPYYDWENVCVPIMVKNDMYHVKNNYSDRDNGSSGVKMMNY